MTRRTVLGIGGVMVGAAPLANSGLLGAGVFADYATGTAEQRTVELPDGSTALLNAGTALDVDFSAGKRRLVLFEGEALFTVTPDAARPFIVEAKGGRTRAVGTVFDVDLRPGGVVTILR